MDTFLGIKSICGAAFQACGRLGVGVDRKRNRVMVPMFMANAVRFYPIP